MKQFSKQSFSASRLSPPPATPVATPSQVQSIGSSPWFRVRRAAEYIGVSPSYIRKAIHLKQLKAVNLALEGTRCEWRIAQHDLDAFMESRRRRV